jgi:hypothetical protein
MGVQIKGGNNSAGLANVSATYEVQVVTPQTEANAGFVQMSSEVDSGAVLGTRTVLPVEVSDDYRLRAGLDQTLFNQSFEGSVVLTHPYNQSLSSMTVTQGSGYLVLNAGNSTTNTNYAVLTTRRAFPLWGTYPTYVDIWLREANASANFAISEWGLGYAATTAAPTDGVFFRRNGAGVLRAVVNFGGTETEETIDTTNVPPRSGVGVFDTSECNHFLIVVHNDIVNFWINDVLVASIGCPDAQPSPTSAAAQPLFMRVYNSGGSASAARRIEVGFINISLGDQHSNKPWGHAMCGLGQGAYQTQTGSSSAQTAQWANSAAPTAISSPSNTSVGAANQGYTTLGGIFILNAVAGAETDYLLFGYQNPTGTNALPGKTLYVTGIRIGETFVTGAAVATTATVLQYAVGVGGSAVSLATTDAATTVKPKVIPLGGQSFAVSAAIGTKDAGFQVDFNGAPLVVGAGSFLAISVRVPVGTATASNAYRGTVTIIGYFE